MNTRFQIQKLRQTPKQQRGVVLALCLILLIILTVFGVAALGTTVGEEGMARNIQESVRAFQNAETGIAQAVRYINENAYKAPDAGADPKVPVDAKFGVVVADIDDLAAGSGQFTVRQLGKENAGGGVKCGEPSGVGSYRFYEYRSNGISAQAGRATVYGGGCLYSPIEPEVFTE